MHTVKPFNLAALKVGIVAFKIILAPFILANSGCTITTRVMPIKVGTVSMFTSFNFAVLLSSRNKGHANIKGFAVNKVRLQFIHCV